MPKDGWQNKELELVFIGGGLFILLLMTGLMIAVLILNQRRKNLHWLVQTDALTNVYNRSVLIKYWISTSKPMRTLLLW